ncbi:hypothetical protein B0T16DRAFT_412969 [Cercophora newfieldiana]|uniref:Uncharacterized protein n=1 Tax=Cercophora newfieldiana TaxID=92897 RepID=A0AA39Y848_9PEZI|nr:hypothetical protein B0T16DRAFT_412969 [Cercophora newfieldiana]
MANKVPPPPPAAPRGLPGGQQQQQPQPTPQQMAQYQQQMQQHQHQKAIINHQHHLMNQWQNNAMRTRDLRDEMPMTKQKAFEEMSAYQMFRFEEALDEGDVDFSNDSWRDAPGWLRVTCVPVPGMAKEDISREVRRLDLETGSVADKKATLTSNQLRHIEAVLEEQQKRMRLDPAVYEINLVQLDHNLRRAKKKDKDPQRSEHDHNRGHHSHHNHHRHSPKTHRPIVLGGLLFPPPGKVHKKPKHGRHESSHGKPKYTKPKVVERAYITAYFKTSPRPNVDPIKLYYEAQAVTEADREFRERRIMEPPKPPQPPEPPQPQPQHQDTLPAGVMQMRGRSRGGDQGRKSRSQSRKQSRGSPRRRRSPGSSPRSNNSSTFTGHDDDRSSTSSVSDRSGSRSPNRGRPRKPSIRTGGFHANDLDPRHFGVGPPPRRHRIDDSNLVRPLAIDPDQLEEKMDDAYAAGVVAGVRRALVDDTLAAVALPKGVAFEQPRYEYPPAPLRIPYRSRRDLEDRMDGYDPFDMDGDFDDRPMCRYVPVIRRRGQGLRGRGVDQLLRGELDEELEMDRRVRDHNEYLTRRGRQGVRDQGTGSYPRMSSYERPSPVSSEDGGESPRVDMRRPFAPRPRI